MKARVKATGEIKEVAQGIYSPYQYVDNEGAIYTENDIEELPGDDGAIFFDPTIDYWEKLLHQYAGMAMQGIMSNPVGFESIRSTSKDCDKKVAEIAICFAKELIAGLKLERSN